MMMRGFVFIFMVLFFFVLWFHLDTITRGIVGSAKIAPAIIAIAAIVKLAGTSRIWTR
jgi:hypothetical protein